MKQLSQLNKNEKIQLLRAVAAGTVGRKTLTQDTFIAVSKQDWFLGLIMQSSNEGLQVVCIGEAAQAEKNVFIIELENEHGEILDTVRTIR